MRRKRKQDPGLVEQLLSIEVAARLADLQSDEAVVLAIECLDHPALAARTKRLEQLVALPDQRRHRTVQSSRAGRR